jgi:hypothetical protein
MLPQIKYFHEVWFYLVNFTTCNQLWELLSKSLICVVFLFFAKSVPDFPEKINGVFKLDLTTFFKKLYIYSRFKCICDDIFFQHDSSAFN